MQTTNVSPLTIGAAAPCTMPPKKENQTMASSSAAHAVALTLYNAGLGILLY